MNPPREQVEFARIGTRGDGITTDGRFVPGALPGDRLLADGVLQRGAGHVPAACRHFGECGGCQLQHAADALLADHARDCALAPLAALGIAPAAVLPTHMSPPHSRRRAAMRATRRAGKVQIGFNARGQHRLVEMAHCPILDPALFALVAPLRALLAPHLADRAAIGITMTLTDNGIDLLLANLQATSLPVIEGLARFADAQGLARLSVDGPMGPETIVARVDPTVRFGGVPVTLPPGAFLQATIDGEAAILAAVRAVVGTAPTVVDLFAGAGTFALPLAAAARCHAVEGAGPAIRALDAAARRASVTLGTEHRDLFRKPLTPPELARFSAAVIDPPRAGAEAQTDALAASAVAVVAAVSCNPATFARDAQRLVAAGFVLDRLWPIAQFRWSTHVELVAEFRR